MPRVLGVDPGTVTIDVFGLDDGVPFLAQSWDTVAALADPDRFAALVQEAGPIDLVAGPSGYGLPLVSGSALTDEDVRLACLAAPGDTGGIGGLRRLMRLLAGLPVPVVFLPGVVHLPTVPPHRKVNRVDMGTADKVCAVALALHQRLSAGGAPRDATFILLELGGAFSAALAVHRGAIVDGMGGTAGPMGLRAAGALDGEVAFLSGTVTKAQLFRGGAAAVAGDPGLSAAALAAGASPQVRLAREAYLESAVKALAALQVSVPAVREIVLSGRVAREPMLQDELTRRVSVVLPGAHVSMLAPGGAFEAKEGARGAAVIADGLAGGRAAPIVEALRLRDAGGTVLDALQIVSPAQARARLGGER